MNTNSLEDTWNAPDLSCQVAVVAGATRGVGRGIAEVLGTCGATVYVTGRSTRETSTRSRSDWTVEAVAETIRSHGGTAIPVRCDHRHDDQVEQLFHRVADEQGRLDILVNNLVGWSDSLSGSITGEPGWADDSLGLPLWEQPLTWWDVNFRGGVRAHVANCRFGIPLMLDQPGGLILFTSEKPRPSPDRAFDTVLDLRAQVTARLVDLLARQLFDYEITCVLLYPGWTRTHDIVAAIEAGRYKLSKTLEDLNEQTVSPQFAGRATACLAADPIAIERSGQVLIAADLARKYGFTDIDGRQPNPL
ncbi:MAG: SDR family NAD(P)-dependent oxidoreductase [Fidelibacterota bacterium]|nr:MAG: SDR family NAD(P)-dependent oxidoreductase [Candidatus Neomarinimicrobiota bacterium]